MGSSMHFAKPPRHSPSLARRHSEAQIKAVTEVLLAAAGTPKAQAKVPHKLYGVCLMANHLPLPPKTIEGC